MKTRKNLVSILIMTCCSSCLYNDTAITEDLGNQYFYLGAANESQILLGDEKKNIGITIIPQEVVEYNFDDRFIIAKNVTKTNNIKNENFWIVDKKNKDSTFSLDSVSFMRKVEKLGLKIKLKPRK